MMGPCAPLNSKDMVVLQVKIPTDKGVEEKNHQFKTEMPSSSQNVVGNISLESLSAKTGVPAQNISVKPDENESDIDSPCWKGTGAHQSTFQVTKPLTSQLLHKTETRARRSLNPLAPLFIPANAKQLPEYHENKYDGSDTLSFQQTASSVVSWSSIEYISSACVKTGTCPSEASGVIGSHSDSISDVGKGFVLANTSNINSLIDDLPGDQLRPIEDHLTSNCQDLMGPHVAGPVNDAIDRGSTGVSFTVTGNVLASSCSRIGVFDFNKTIQGASKSTPVKTDVQLLINTMHDLSELLMCYHLDSINEHEYDMIQQIINNLCVCITNDIGQRVSEPESGHPCTSYGPKKLSNSHKESQEASMKAMIVPHNQEREKSPRSMFSKKLLSSCPRIDGGGGVDKSDDVTQIVLMTQVFDGSEMGLCNVGSGGSAIVRCIHDFWEASRCFDCSNFGQ